MAPLGDIYNWDQPNKHGVAGMYVGEEGGQPILYENGGLKKIFIA